MSDPLKHLLDREVRTVQPRLNMQYIMDRARRRQRVRRASAGLTGLAGFVVILVILRSLVPAAIDVAPSTEASTPSAAGLPAVAIPGTCDYGPWIEHCPEADWARSVLSAAGYPIVDDTGAAFVVSGPQESEFFFWAMDPLNHRGVQPLDEVLSEEAPPVADRIDGVVVYLLDGRWVWSSHDLNVWIELTSRGDLPVLALQQIVRSAEAVPYSVTA